MSCVSAGVAFISHALQVAQCCLLDLHAGIFLEAVVTGTLLSSKIIPHF